MAARRTVSCNTPITILELLVHKITGTVLRCNHHKFKDLGYTGKIRVARLTFLHLNPLCLHLFIISYLCTPDFSTFYIHQVSSGKKIQYVLHVYLFNVYFTNYFDKHIHVHISVDRKSVV